MKVLILGAGGHGQVVGDIVRAEKCAGRDVVLAGYLDDAKQGPGGPPVHGPLRAWRDVAHDALIVAIGNNATRRTIFDDLLRMGAAFATTAHPASTIAPDVSMGLGTMICAGVVINTKARVGRNVIVNTSASVDHHCRIADHVHIAPGVRLGGDVEVGEGALVGIGAVVIPGMRIGAWSIVSAGAVVTEDVPPNTTVVGVPARALSRVC
jgi:sugar O-acyltransferase (sialic acid O-acetyltransferase NeuD family)